MKKLKLISLLVFTFLFSLAYTLLNKREVNKENFVSGYSKFNLIFILTDEQRFDTSFPYGNKLIKTPYLNLLGERGVVFEHAYVTQPHCSPARSSLLTGLYPHSTGVTTNNIPLQEGIKTLPELVDDPAYATAYIGKWHLGRELDAWHGFQTRISTEDNYTSDDTTRFSDYHNWLLEKGFQPDHKANGTFTRDFAARLPLEYTKSKFMEEKTLNYLEANKEHPFIIYLGFLEPHTPNTGPFDELHDPALIMLDSTYGQSLPEKAPMREQIIASEREPLGRGQLKEEMARYWGLVHQVDLSVGAIMQKLEELELDNNTIIVFTSEHGKMMGKFNLDPKRLMYEPSSRIPWMMYIPGLAHRHIRQKVSQIDMVPTLLELMGQYIPAHLQGKSLLPLMKGHRIEIGPVFVEWNPFRHRRYQKPVDMSEEKFVQVIYQHIRTVVTQDGWKLNWSEKEMDTSQLFNLKEDPLETNNLYYMEAYQDHVRQLKQLIINWQELTSDTVSMDSQKPFSAK